MLGWIVQNVLLFFFHTECERAFVFFLFVGCYFCQSCCCTFSFRFSLQSLRFFAFGSFTFLFHHFHVVCCHRTILSSSLPFSISPPRSSHSTFIYSSIHPSIHFRVGFFFFLLSRWWSAFFQPVFFAFIWRKRSTHQLLVGVRIQSCGANITLAIIRKPFLLFFLSFSSVRSQWYYDYYCYFCCCCCCCRRLRCFWCLVWALVRFFNGWCSLWVRFAIYQHMYNEATVMSFRRTFVVYTVNRYGTRGFAWWYVGMSAFILLLLPPPLLSKQM